MKISIIQNNPKTADIEGNFERLKKSIAEADVSGTELIIVSENSFSGINSQYLCNYNSNSSNCADLKHKAETFLNQIASLKTKAEILLRLNLMNEDDYITDEAVAIIKNGQFKTYSGGYVFMANRKDHCHVFAGKKTFITSSGYYKCNDELNPEKADLLIAFGEDYYRRGRIAEITEFLAERAKKEKSVLVYVNPCGGNDSEIYFGNSMIISPEGKIIAEAPAFEDVILTADTEKAVPYNPEPREDIADIANALVMGMRDFFGKQGFTKAVIGLSGGIDSAVVAALTAKAIGGENVLGVLMPSEYTSQDSIDQALELAKNLGMPTRIIPIKNIFNTLKQEIGLSDEKTENGKVSLALQNLQSRSRGITIMALSNSEGRIAIATGNKSEIAVGYCTLYGDTVGSIAPIADLLKTEVYELAGYINRHKEIIPKGTIARPPSAELSPNQKDEDDLPPYSQLDKIVRMFVEEEKGLAEITASGIPQDVAVKTIRRIENNEFKRRQLPMGLKIAKGTSFFYEWEYPLVKKNLY